VGIILILIYQCYSQICVLSGWNFQPLTNTSFSAKWTPPGSTLPQNISLTPCTPGLPVPGCGYGNYPKNQCNGVPNCCAVCQTWQEDTGPQGACLGRSGYLNGVTRVDDKQVKISYIHGDYVDITPRTVDIYITCVSNGGILSFVDFVQPKPVIPPPPAWNYSLYLSSTALCTVPALCTLQGFHFNYISAFKNYSSPWTPPRGVPETISYAPCSSGISSGCGSSGQCANMDNCCAVCQSWTTGSGSEGACLGLSSDLIEITPISNIGVRITYGSGDRVGQTERTVDVVIFCDPEAELLSFVDFIPPQLQNPPPPYYHYVLILSSYDLCGPPDNIEQFLKKYFH